LLLVLSTIRILAQSEIPQPAPEENEIAAAAKTSSNPSDQPTPLTKTQATAKSSIANGRNKTAQTQSDKPKRGQLIITPIPISSPSVWTRVPGSWVCIQTQPKRQGIASADSWSRWLLH
jgi:hypothetical protein